MTEQELQYYILQNFPKENEKCEWKEFKSLKSSISGRAGEDVISYVSAISNMEGGHLIIGVMDKTLKYCWYSRICRLFNRKYKIQDFGKLYKSPT